MAGEVRHCTVEHSEWADELFPRAIPREYVVGRAGHERGRRVQSFEERRDRGRHDAGQGASSRAECGALTQHGQPRELPTLFVVKTKRVGQRCDHTQRWSRVASLLETNQIVDADPGECRNFFAAQTRGAPAAAVGQADVTRLQLLAASTEELGQRRHTYSIADSR